MAGRDVPDVLPPSLVPPFPRIRTEIGVPVNSTHSANDDQSIRTQPASASGVTATNLDEVPIVPIAEDESQRSSTPPPPYESLPTALP